MIIEELKFVGIRERLKGRSTKPMVIWAEDESKNIVPYALKLYKDDYVTNYFTIAKEVLISELAGQFNLPVPKYGLINVNHKVLVNEYNADYLDKINVGYKFFTYYHEGTLLYNSSLNNSFLKNYDIENVFAFDNLVLNID